jgi:hypothetical protein
MVRQQSVSMAIVWSLVLFCAIGGQSSIAGDRILPIVADDVSNIAQPASVGYAEAENTFDCEPCDAPCCPLWTVGAGAIFLNRNHATARPTAKFYRGATRQTYELARDMGDTDLGMAAGPDISLTRCLNPCWDIEARYFQLDGWGDRQEFSSPNGVMLTAYNAEGFGNAMSYGYSSRLYNIELNLRWKRYERLPFLMGFRTLGLDEGFQVAADTGEGFALGIDTQTHNTLYGFQAGVAPVLWDRCGPFRVEGLLKAGVYANNANQRTRFVLAEQESNGRNTTTAFVGELGLIGAWRLNDCWSLRAGYEVLWISDLALAPDQSSTVQFGFPPAGEIYDRATAFYHGATASIERRF